MEITMRYSYLMFLQFFIWSSWYNTVNLYMIKQGMPDQSIYWIYSFIPIVLVFSTLIKNFIATLFKNLSHLLSTLFVLAGVTMLLIPAMDEENHQVFYVLTFLHILFYTPTLSLGHYICYTSLKQNNALGKLALIRTWGTVGWIFAVSANSLSFMGETNVTQFYLCGISSIVLGVFCFTSLPRILAAPPTKKSTYRDFFLIDIFKFFFTKWSFFISILVFVAVAILFMPFSISPQQQMQAMGISNIGLLKGLGHWPEIVFMILTPFLLVKIGPKKMIGIGMLALFFRYFLFYLSAKQNSIWYLMAGMFLHGICYTFFFIGIEFHMGQIYEKSEEKLNQFLSIFGQGGIGSILGVILTQFLMEKYLSTNQESIQPASLENWASYWLFLLVGIAIIFFIFSLFFQETNKQKEYKGQLLMH